MLSIQDGPTLGDITDHHFRFESTSDPEVFDRPYLIWDGSLL
jgi:hypothetical protein